MSTPSDAAVTPPDEDAIFALRSQSVASEEFAGSFSVVAGDKIHLATRVRVLNPVARARWERGPRTGITVVTPPGAASAVVMPHLLPSRYGDGYAPCRVEYIYSRTLLSSTGTRAPPRLWLPMTATP